MDNEVKCDACGAMVPRKEVRDNGHTIWTEDDYTATPKVCGPVEDDEETKAAEDFAERAWSGNS